MKHETFPTIDTPIAAHLRKALALLEAQGWTQMPYSIFDGPTCAAVALYNTDQTFYSAAYSQFATANHINDIVGWNDIPGRTFAEIRAAFLKAIEAANRA